MQRAPAIALALAGIAWLWLLARGRAAGAKKRLALRATLLAATFALVAVGARRGLFTRTTAGFRVALLLAILTVAVGYLYLIRFCPACGRMVRNLKDAACPRCGDLLPVHGMTSRLRAPAGQRRGDGPGRRAPRPPAEGPRA